MTQVRLGKQELNCKLVYYGPEGAGKSATLRAIARQSPHVDPPTSLNREGARPPFFEYMQPGPGRIARLRAHAPPYAGRARRHPGKLLDGGYVRRVVGRGQGVVVDHAADDILVERYHARDIACVHGLEADRAQFLQRVQAPLGTYQPGKGLIDSTGVVRKMALLLDLFAVADTVGMHRACAADAIHAAAGQYLAGWHVEDLVFERSAA